MWFEGPIIWSQALKWYMGGGKCCNLVDYGLRVRFIKEERWVFSEGLVVVS